MNIVTLAIVAIAAALVLLGCIIALHVIIMRQEDEIARLKGEGNADRTDT